MKKAYLLLLWAGLAFGQDPTPAPPTPTQQVEPSQLYSAGMGIADTDKTQTFGYYSISKRLVVGTYATAINEFVRLKGGKISTCARAGISKVLWRVNGTSFGLVGDAGLCEAGSGNAGAALGERSFISQQIKKSNWYIIGSAEHLNVAGGSNQIIVTLGIGFGVR